MLITCELSTSNTLLTILIIHREINILMEFPKPGFNLRGAIDQINAGDDLSRLPDEELVISESADSGAQP